MEVSLKKGEIPEFQPCFYSRILLVTYEILVSENQKDKSYRKSLLPFNETVVTGGHLPKRVLI